MNRIHILFLIFLAFTSSLFGQVPQYNYFPEDLMKAEGIKSYTVYETKIDDPVQQSGQANRIRLAKNAVRQAYFNHDGQIIRKVWLNETGKLVQKEWICSFDTKGQKEIETLKHYHSNNSDSTSLLQTTEIHWKFGAKGELLVKNSYLRNDDKLVHTDSTAYNRDNTRQLLEEVSTQMNASESPVLFKKYNRNGSNLIVETIVNDAIINHEEYLLDEKGRVTEAKYFTGTESAPRLQMNYLYHPRGWLEEINYIHNWDFFDKEETVVACKYLYDDHGKLFESQKDYGDGKRLFEFFDYGYFVNE